MTERTGRPWLNYLLGLLCVGAIVAAILVVGPASGSTTTATRTAKAAQGVVQSTVSGSGNLQPASQLNLGFKTSGTVTNIYVTQGEYVTEGKLLATLDPQSAEVTLEQAKATLLSAEANLAKEEETDGESATGSGGSQAAGGATAAAASLNHASGATLGAGTSPDSSSSAIATAATVTATRAMPTDAPPRPTSPSTTAPSGTTTPGTTTSPATTTTPTTTSTEPTHTTSAPKTTIPQSSQGESRSSGSSSKGSENSGSSASKSVVSTATREANLASARAAVKSDQLTVQSDERAVGDTKLYAPQDGTIVSLSGQVGEVVSGSGTTKSSSSSSASSSATGSSATGGSSAAGRSATGSSSASSGSGSSTSSSSAFAVLSDLSSMQLVVPLSESEIGNVKVGQIATVSVEALEGHTQGASSGVQASKLAAHVSEVATIATSSSGVVSYDVTFQLDQMQAGLKPGMSATAEVVVKQAEGVSVPTSAISADTVTVVRNGKDVRQRVVTGLAGNSTTLILSGVKAGETVGLPAATSTSSSTSLTSRLSRLGGGGGLGGAGGGGLAGGGGAAFFRGGG